MPEQFGVESCDHQGVAADAGGFTAQTRANGFDEVGNMLVDGGRSEFGSYGNLSAESTVRPVTRDGLRPVSWS
ncbi:hypothetical protein G9444_2582 [Rhodococcus erythropolis]|uniref:Uncharacterized protein n=1 Tax=Rhodococcus erythropolis TaxID=1833 RepID=A0A6G9CS01_RHOER|nr:hypothetical protein G9444_2582 [Rhodococcus erythropolis]